MRAFRRAPVLWLAALLAAFPAIAAGPAAATTEIADNSAAANTEIIAAPAPQTASPGSSERILRVAARCPTFSWSAQPAATGYELAVYRLPEEDSSDAAADGSQEAATEEAPASEEPSLVLRTEVPAGVSSWTPSLDRCFESGARYAWVVRAWTKGEATEWSKARLFEVDAVIVRSELEEVMRGVLARYFGATAQPEAETSGESAALPSAAVSPHSAAAAPRLPEGVRVPSADTNFLIETKTPERVAILGLSSTSGGSGVSTPGTGVRGVSRLPAGRGVEGFGFTDDGPDKAIGVYGQASSDQGRGVWGLATGDFGVGVFGSAVTGSAGQFENFSVDQAAVSVLNNGDGGTALSVKAKTTGFDLLLAGTGKLKAGTGVLKVLSTLEIPAPFNIDLQGGQYLGDGSALTGVSVSNVNCSECVETGDIANNAVTSVKMAASAVSGGSGGTIVDGSITADDLGAGSVGSSEMATGAVTGGLAGPIVDNSITADDLGADSVGSSEMADGAVSGGIGGTIADASISGIDIADGSIAAIDIADGSGSGLDADTLDTLDSAALLQKAELDTEAELEAQLADVTNVLVSTELDAESELEALLADVTNVLVSTELDAEAELEALLADVTNVLVSTELDAEAELEALLADVTDVLTNNDTIEANTLGGLSSGDFLEETELDTQAELEAQLTDVSNVLVSTELDAEAELEALLADVTDVLTNNDTIEADTLGGLSSAAFVLKSGDTMTGALTLPLNGLVAGTSQLVISSGKVGIGTASPVDLLQVAGDIRVGTGTDGCVKDADGTVLTGTCSSDIRLKKNIRPLGRVLPSVSRLTPVHFDWRADEFPELALGTGTQLGLIAQQVEEILPDLVAEGSDGFKRVRYGALPVILLQAVGDQHRENEQLRRHLRRLTERIDALERALRP